MNSPTRSIDADPTPWLLGATLALGLAVQMMLPAPPPPAAPVHSERPIHAADPPSAAPGIPPFTAIATRPLFSPTRSTSTAADEDVAAPGTLKLLGVASGPGGATAVLGYTTGSPQVVPLGGALLGWRVRSISPEAAVITRGGTSETLQVGVPAPASRAEMAMQRQQP